MDRSTGNNSGVITTDTKVARAQAKSNRTARRADHKAHRSTGTFPGGYRDTKKARAAKESGNIKSGTIDGRTKADDLNALEKYQSYDKWQAEQKK